MSKHQQLRICLIRKGVEQLCVLAREITTNVQTEMLVEVGSAVLEDAVTNYIEKMDDVCGTSFDVYIRWRLCAAMVTWSRSDRAKAWESQLEAVGLRVDEEALRGLVEADPDGMLWIMDGLEPVEREVLRTIYWERLAIEQLARQRGVSCSWLERVHRRALLVVRLRIRRA